MNSGFPDQDLIAFLDGVAEAGLAARIEAAVKTDQALLERITELDVDTDTLGHAFDPILGLARSRNLDHKLDCAVSKQAANTPKRPALVFRVMTYPAAVAVGFVLGWNFLIPASDWRTEVAHYQALYVADTLMPVAPDADRLQAEFARASDLLGLVIEPDMFKAVEGLQLRRAQVLGFNGLPLVQIAFTRPDGTPFAFCILQEDGQASETVSDTLVGLASASWDTPTHRFLAIGGTDTTVILDIANQLKQRF